MKATEEILKQLRKGWSAELRDNGLIEFEYREARPKRTIVRGFATQMSPDNPRFHEAVRAHMDTIEAQVQKEIKAKIWD